MILANLGVRDERVFHVLLDLLEKDPELGAMELAEYGDPRALEHLSRAFDAAPLEGGDTPLANQTIIELCEAIIDLGGSLTPSQQRKFDTTLALRTRGLGRITTRTDRPGPPSPSPNPGHPPGRNDPCRCGSGKKYKKCHLDADQRGGT